MAFTALDYQKKVQAYFVAELGRPATASELATYAQKLADNSGNVWKAGLVGVTGYLTTLSAFPASATANEYIAIVQAQYLNLTGTVISDDLQAYYVDNLVAGNIKLKGLSNAIINDAKLMPKADGTIGQPANWVVDNSAQVTEAGFTALKSKLDYAQGFTGALDTNTKKMAYEQDSSFAKAALAAVTDGATKQQQLDNTELTQVLNNTVAAVYPTVSGTVIDGYISGATVFADTDGDGVQDADEVSGTTDANGNFTLAAGASGRVVASGGTDILTGKAFQGVLTAPLGSNTVTPLTTLVQSAIESGKTLAEAKTSIAQSLGIDASVDITTYDPIAALATNANDTAALAVQKVAQQVAAIISQATNAIDAGDATQTSTQIASEVAKQLTQTLLTSESGTVVDLTQASTISTIVSQAATSVGVTSVAEKADQIAAVTAASNDQISQTTNLTDLVKAAIVSQSDAVDTLKDAVTNNTLDTASSSFTSGIDTLVNNTEVTGSLTSETSIVDAVTAAPPDATVPTQPTTPPTPTTPTTPTTPPAPTPTTTATLSGDTVSFGGTTSGDLTISISSNDVSFSRGGVLATESITSINDKKIDFVGNIIFNIAGSDQDEVFVVNAPSATKISFASATNLGGGSDRIQLIIADAENNASTLNLDATNLDQVEGSNTTLMFALSDAKDTLMLSNTSVIKTIDRIEYGAYNFNAVVESDRGGLDLSEVTIGNYGAPQIIAIGQINTVDAV